MNDLMNNKQESFLNFINLISKKKIDYKKLLNKSKEQTISITFVNPLNFKIILNYPEYLETLKNFDYVLLLEPTSPKRDVKNLKKIIKKAVNSNLESVKYLVIVSTNSLIDVALPDDTFTG